ncbi:MAG: type I-B CRISPR-associated protein Cas5b [Synergistaceae bacterium]|jgi:CRISPR-associated protein Cas5h|nr:type I-B CRISPR-associated protein Cas5b [Synergistaceae bacterium]
MSVVFDCSSDIAMFRKPYTTTSSVSFAFPPPTAVAGLIGSIVGLDNNASENASNAAYWSAFSGTSVAISIKKSVQWLRAAINFWNTKDPQKSPHIQVKHQFVFHPEYRIFVKNGIESRLREKLEKSSFVYTPYLGVAYALAEVSYVGYFEDFPISEKVISVGTVLPFCDDVQLDFAAKLTRVFKEIVPFKLSEDRAFLESKTVLYSDIGDNKLILKNRGSVNVTRSMDEFVAWFPEW